MERTLDIKKTTTRSKTGIALLLSRGMLLENEQGLLFGKIIGLCIFLHFPIALLIQRFPVVATAHAFIVLCVLLYLVFAKKPVWMIVAGMAYVAGSEILWRIGKAEVFWEFGKYLISLLAILTLIRERKFTRIAKLPALYFLCLLPSLAVLPFFDRQDISFNLSGPLCLVSCTVFLGVIKLQWRDIQRILIAILVGIASIGFLAIVGLASVEQMDVHGSSKISSAGFGPNQVSSILGLGAMIAFFHCLYFSRTKASIYSFALTGSWLLMQCALTFSRGGFWNMLAASAIAAIILARKHKFIKPILFGCLAIFLAAAFLIIPKLDEFTQGNFSKRFESLHTTGRKEIAEADLNIFIENPLFGVGPGRSVHYHYLELGSAKRAHTEYSRLLAEHGLFGVASAGVLIIIGFQRFNQKSSKEFKALILALTIWSLLYLLHASMRLSVAGFVFGLGAIQLKPSALDIKPFLRLLLNEDTGRN